MKSIQSKLATGLLISLIIVFLILWYAVSYNIQKLSENYIASRLEHDVETLLTAISFDKNNKLSISEQHINSIYKRPFSGHYYTIQHKQRLIRSRSLWDQNLTSPEIVTGDYVKTLQAGPENQSLLTISRRFNKQNQNIVISAFEDLTPVIEDIKQFKSYFTVLSSFILFSLLIIQFNVLKVVLKPLRKMRKELNQLEKGNIKALTTDVPSELNSVVNEVNHLSSALHKRLKRSRDALSDLSHAIKKPLTLLQQFSDEHQNKFDQNSNIFFKNQISAVQQTTDNILKRARVAGTTRFNTPFNINEDLALLIKSISTLYPEKNINLTIDIPEIFQIQIDREDMLELLGNLLDNAWKWAESAISVLVTKTSDITIIIEDDGPGANADSLNELTQRGVRLDESVSGYGFGLAISSDIIRDYEGSLNFSRSASLGGFKIEIHLPVNR